VRFSAAFRRKKVPTGHLKLMERNGNATIGRKLEIYEQLWSDAAAAFERGEPKIDDCLSDKTKDLRRGVTLVCRPAAKVRDAVADYIGRLAAICPGQYFYRPEEMHVTVLSIITMTELWRAEMERFEACRPMIKEALAAQRSFKMKFRGMTAARDSVMVQGFPADDGLATIRDALREAFARAGFSEMLDRRYKVSAAHITIMRFYKPCPEIKRLLAFLKTSRELDFGECEIGSIELIWGDWYASADKVKVLEEYRLLD
jgi:2'-5' RNA ligase